MALGVRAYGIVGLGLRANVLYTPKLHVPNSTPDPTSQLLHLESYDVPERIPLAKNAENLKHKPNTEFITSTLNPRGQTSRRSRL